MKRDEKIDIMKGLAILLMVMGHSGFLFTDFIYLFHMAVFFMISGYLFSLRKVTTVKEITPFIWRKVKGIWWPYFLWNALYTVLNNIFIKIGVYSTDSFLIGELQVEAHSVMTPKQMFVNIIKGVFMVGRTELGGAFWFLRTLFGLSILFALTDFILNKLISNDKYADVIHCIISVVLMCGGYATYLMDVKSLSIPIVLSVYILYFMGYAIKKYDFIKYIKSWIALPVSMIILLICDPMINISLGSNRYGNPGYLLVCSLAGWLLLYNFADIISHLRCKNILTLLGKNTLTIVIHHFWCLKLVHIIQILLYKYPSKYIAAFPYLNPNGLWWVAYTTVGITAPLAISCLYKKVANLVCGKNTAKT